MERLRATLTLAIGIGIIGTAFTGDRDWASDKVFHDENRNGRLDSKESGISGILVSD